MKRFNWIFIMGLLAGLIASMSFGLGCDDDDDDDDLFDDDDDDDDDIADVPDDVNDFLDQADLDALEDAGMTIYKGDNPPNIEGGYLLDSLVITYDEIGMEGYSIAPYTMTYYDQTTAGDIKNDYESPQVGDYGNGIGGFISGDDGCFTVYLDIEGNANGCDYGLPAIHSGCLNTSGIADFDWGFIMKWKQGTNCEALMPEEAVRIINESDDLASET